MAAKKKTSARTSTVFDDVYRTMAQKLPAFFLPLINEMFDAHYPLDIAAEQLRNEHFTRGKKRITDSVFLIKDTTYHIECQSSEDGTMALRMFEYDFQIAMEKQQETGKIRFPYAGVLYLRGAATKKRDLALEVVFPDGQSLTYEPKQLSVSSYDLDSIFQKKLLLLLPYYILRYENQIADIASDTDKTIHFLEEYQEIVARLQQNLPTEENAAAYLALVQLIERISHYVLKQQNTLKKGVDHIMGGRLIPLYAEKVEKRGEARGETRGILKGLRGIMHTMHLSLEQAMDAMQIPAADRPRITAELKG